MDKSIYSKDYALLLQHLRATRENAGVTQQQLAANLRQTQSFVSKCERGERRLDFVELRAFCKAMHVDFSKFVAALNHRLEKS